MSLPKAFWEQLPFKADAELYGMFLGQDDYQREALAAARDELSKRNLAPERVAHIKARVRSQKNAEEIEAQRELGWPMRIFVFILFGHVSAAVLAIYYESKGNERKASDCWVDLGIGVVSHCI